MVLIAATSEGETIQVKDHCLKKIRPNVSGRKTSFTKTIGLVSDVRLQIIDKNNDLM